MFVYKITFLIIRKRGIDMDYILRYRDMPVIEFNLDTRNAKIIHNTLLPFNISQLQSPWDMITKFCADRILISQRHNADKILFACGCNQLDPVQICITCNGLSLKDHYWITDVQDNRKWDHVNLYDNDFNPTISKIGLTGNLETINEIITPELTVRGVRCKGFYRDDTGIYLAKVTTDDEENSELLSGYIANAINLPHATYAQKTIYDVNCHVCKIGTNNNTEMLHARDVLSHFKCEMSNFTDYYTYFMEQDMNNFIKMQLFDYLTLNTDRNRDNFALQKRANQITGLYPVFDHDSLFKGKSTKAIYFVTNLSFDTTLTYLKDHYCFVNLQQDLETGYDIMTTPDFKDIFLHYKSIDYYNSMIQRYEKILK